jgi:hypothetical protein
MPATTITSTAAADATACNAQVALKAAQKQLASLNQPGKAADTAAPQSSANGSSSRPGTSATNGSSNGRSNGSSSDPLMQQKLSELEGALRQATSDYALILRELGAMRAEGASRQAGLDEALAGKAAAEAELKR